MTDSLPDDGWIFSRGQKLPASSVSPHTIFVGPESYIAVQLGGDDCESLPESPPVVTPADLGQGFSEADAQRLRRIAYELNRSRIEGTAPTEG